MAFKKAVKEQSKLRLAMGGIAGSGKTFSALKVASELSKLMRAAKLGDGRIAVLDSERGSASLYADKFEFDVCELDSFSPLEYVARIKEAEEAGYDFIIPDSLSHAWAGKDGALAQKDQIAERSSSGNSWTAWRTVTPKHDALIDAMLQSKAHVIATMRQKMEYIQDKNEKGQTEIKQVGLGFVQRDQIDFEFTLVGSIDVTHTLKISKTRVDGIDIGDQFEKPGEDFARKLWQWLTSGAAPAPRPEPVADTSAVDTLLAAIDAASDQATLDKIVTGPNKPAKGTDAYAKVAAAYLARKAQLTTRAAS